MAGRGGSGQPVRWGGEAAPKGFCPHTFQGSEDQQARPSPLPSNAHPPHLTPRLPLASNGLRTWSWGLPDSMAPAGLFLGCCKPTQAAPGVQRMVTEPHILDPCPSLTEDGAFGGMDLRIPPLSQGPLPAWPACLGQRGALCTQELTLRVRPPHTAHLKSEKSRCGKGVVQTAWRCAPTSALQAASQGHKGGCTREGAG